MKRSLYLPVLVLLLTCACSFEVRSETLRGALVKAYDHSGLLDQNRALMRAADEDVAIAVSRLRPIVSYSARLQRQFGSSAGQDYASTDLSLGISAELTVYDGGRSQLAVDAAKEAVLATRAGLVAVEQNVLLQAVSAYMNVRRELEIVALRRSNLRLLREELRAARDRFDVGEITRTDVALAESRLALSDSQHAAAVGALKRAQAEYKRAIGYTPEKLQAPGNAPKIPRTASEAVRTALQSHPDMTKVQHDVAAAEINVERARRAKEPTVNLRGSVSASERFLSQQQGDSVGASISLEATGPIYRGGEIPALQRQAMARRDAQRAGLHIVKHQIEQNIANAYANLEVTRASRRASEEQVRAARVAFRGVREEATLGARTTLDVLNAENELLNARASLISAQVDELLAAYQVLAATGRMTARQLELPVQQYDPAAYYRMIKDAPSGNSKQGDALDRVLRSLGKN